MQEQDPGGPVVISSLVVHTRGSHTDAVGGAIVKSSGHKFAVVLETASTEDAAALTERIQTTEGVTGIELVAHFFEDEVLDSPDPSDKG